jgi:hypothetical protein
MGEETARLRQEIDRTRDNLTRDVDQLADRTSPSRVVQRRVQRTRRGLTGLKDRVMGANPRQDERYRTGSGLGYGDFGYDTYSGDTYSGDTYSGDTYSGDVTASPATETTDTWTGNGGSSRSRSAAEATAHAAQTVRGSVRDAGDRAGDAVSDVRSGVREQTEGNPLAAGLIAFGVGWLVSSLLPASQAETRAAQRVEGVAREHGGPVIEEAKQSVQDVGHNLQGSAQDALAQVKNRAQDAAGTVREEAGNSASV